MKRQFDLSRPELMDLARLVNGKPTQELKRDLANLRWLNRHFGAVSLLHHFLRRWFGNRDPRSPHLRVLDLATGEGDLPREIIRWCRVRKLDVMIDAVDLNAATLSVARERSDAFPEITFHHGDIRFWGEEKPVGSGGWDLVLCSLALHHFSNKDAVAVLRNARRLASRTPGTAHRHTHLLVADLERSWLGALGIWLLTSMMLREPMTVHDARLSIRRAFSYREFSALAHAAGWKEFSQSRFPITRQALWIGRVGEWEGLPAGDPDIGEPE